MGYASRERKKGRIVESKDLPKKNWPPKRLRTQRCRDEGCLYCCWEAGRCLDNPIR